MPQQEVPTPLRVGVVGCGGSRQTYGAALASLASLKVTALMDVDMASARAWSRQIGACRVHHDFDAFLEDAAADAVVLATPTDVRAHQAERLLAAGKALLVEAPAAREASGYRRLMDEASRAGALLVPAYVMRYEPALKATRAALDRGDIGEPRELRCEWAFYAGWATRKTAFRRWPDVMVHYAAHTLDLARWWLGDAVAVSADIDTASDVSRRTDLANLIVQHQRGVSVHHIYRSSRRPRYEHLVLSGSEGVIEVTGPASGALDRSGALAMSLHRPGREPEPFQAPERPRLPVRGQIRWPYRDMLEDFARAVAGQGPAQVGVDDGLCAQVILDAAVLSSFEGVKIQMTTGPNRLLPGA